jgi:hypothetical protein
MENDTDTKQCEIGRQLVKLGKGLIETSQTKEGLIEASEQLGVCSAQLKALSVFGWKADE